MSKFITMKEFAEKISEKRPDINIEMKKTEQVFQLTRQIIDLRVKRNLTQKELAKKANLHQYQISKMERGQFGNVNTLIKILNALDAKLEFVDNEIILKDLFENYNKKYKPEKINWDKPQGDEIW